MTGSVIGNASLTFHVGELTHEFRNGTGIGAGLSGTIQTFCIDLAQDSSSLWQVYSLVPLPTAPNPAPPMGAAKAQAIADVVAGAAGAQHLTDDYAAAFQMMLWEIVADYDGTPASINLTGGTVRFSAATPTYPNVLNIFGTLKSYIGTGASLDFIRGASNPEFQDQLVTFVPTPGAGVLAGAGLVAFAARRRRA